MREMLLMRYRDPVAPSVPQAGSGPFTDAIQSQNSCLFERGRVEGAGRVRFVVLREGELLLVGSLQACGDLTRQVQLLVQPYRHCLSKRGEPLRGVGKICLHEALK